MAILPQMSYIGNFSEFPENVMTGQIIKSNGIFYVYTGNDWVPLHSSKKSVTISKLLDFLERYEDSSLKQDILELVESYRICGYE